MPRFFQRLLPVVTGLFLSLLILLPFSLVMDSDIAAPSDAAQDGRIFLESLESASTTVVDDILKERRSLYLSEMQNLQGEQLEQQRTDLQLRMESGEANCWSLLEDYAILGDSRGCGFTSGSFLSPSRVFAHYGDNISNIAQHIPALKSLNPSYIFLIYGLNDLLLKGCETPELFAQCYKGVLDQLQEEFPDAKIYVNSIFPVTGPAFGRHRKWVEAPDYSDAVRIMCELSGYYFIPNENIYGAFELYEGDGVHFIKPFYQKWGENMVLAVFDSEHPQRTNQPRGNESSEGSPA